MDEAAAVMQHDERVGPTYDASSVSKAVADEGDGVVMDRKDRTQRRTGTRRWRQTLGKERIAEPMTVAEGETKRGRKDLHCDEEAPSRNVRPLEGRT